MTTSFLLLNNMPEMGFMAGSDKVYTYTCYQEDGVNLLDITSGTVVWRLCPYGQFDVVSLQISGVITTANTFTITVPSASTLTMGGKYIQQIEITDFFGNNFIPGQGELLIFPAIR